MWEFFGKFREKVTLITITKSHGNFYKYCRRCEQILLTLQLPEKNLNILTLAKSGRTNIINSDYIKL
jgi:hypothetical protein